MPKQSTATAEQCIRTKESGLFETILRIILWPVPLNLWSGDIISATMGYSSASMHVESREAVRSYFRSRTVILVWQYVKRKVG